MLYKQGAGSKEQGVCLLEGADGMRYEGLKAGRARRRAAEANASAPVLGPCKFTTQWL